MFIFTNDKSSVNLKQYGFIFIVLLWNIDVNQCFFVDNIHAQLQFLVLISLCIFICFYL